MAYVRVDRGAVRVGGRREVLGINWGHRLSRGDGRNGGSIGSGRGDFTNNKVLKVVVKIITLGEVVRGLHGQSHDGSGAVGDAGDEGKSNFGRHVI